MTQPPTNYQINKETTEYSATAVQTKTERGEQNPLGLWYLTHDNEDTDGSLYPHRNHLILPHNTDLIQQSTLNLTSAPLLHNSISIPYNII
jgi:hypothetical protein